MHSLRCKCRVVQGQLKTSGTHNRLICYCSDCRAFARYLGKGTDVLDTQGGTEIIQIGQSCLRFHQGEDRLTAIRLTDKGVIRWYTSCCGTPIGNTLANPKISVIGLIHTCLDRVRMDEDFGGSIAAVNTDSALGEPKPKQCGTLGVAVRLMWIVFGSRIGGAYRESPLFYDSGSPRVSPTTLSYEELARLKSTV